ncbi:hypothetical protein SAMN05660748_0295 [Blastococcus aggregatus]|uniref:Uncharacterized protein n=1 Tax=Blastococcus aggregatus TaxID=38502 RepID=A0A285UX77_9ACTN|nr:hypothetical protein [Blastococcus aggregatus]SOC46525.1 hypothetical protein SAMN05660748_0295 [Blastococcus aggregatus]
MTHSIDAPLPPPTTTAGSTGQSSTSTKDVAAEEARNVGQTAAQAGSQVASTATDQAREVAHETQRQAQDLLKQGQSQLKDQAVAQQQKAASGLTSLAGELRSLADGTSQGAPGPARDLLQQASGYLEGFADKLQNREPAQLLDEVRSLARRRPGMFLLGAAAAGIVAGRLTSGVRAAHTDSDTSGPAGGYPTTNYVDPTPTYSDTAYTDPASAYTGTGAAYTTAGSAPLPPPPYGTVPPEGSIVPPASPAGWDDPARRPGGVG